VKIACFHAFATGDYFELTSQLTSMTQFPVFHLCKMVQQRSMLPNHKPKTLCTIEEIGRQVLYLF
jgi:hypothetical protein